MIGWLDFWSSGAHYHHHQGHARPRPRRWRRRRSTSVSVGMGTVLGSGLFGALMVQTGQVTVLNVDIRMSCWVDWLLALIQGRETPGGVLDVIECHAQAWFLWFLTPSWGNAESLSLLSWRLGWDNGDAENCWENGRVGENWSGCLRGTRWQHGNGKRHDRLDRLRLGLQTWLQYFRYFYGALSWEIREIHLKSARWLCRHWSSWKATHVSAWNQGPWISPFQGDAHISCNVKMRDTRETARHARHVARVKAAKAAKRHSRETQRTGCSWTLIPKLWFRRTDICRTLRIKELESGES